MDRVEVLSSTGRLFHVASDYIMHVGLLRRYCNIVNIEYLHYQFNLIFNVA